MAFYFTLFYFILFSWPLCLWPLPQHGQPWTLMRGREVKAGVTEEPADTQEVKGPQRGQRVVLPAPGPWPPVSAVLKVPRLSACRELLSTGGTS